MLLSGGPRAYWNAVAFQGGADLSGVTMLWTTPTPRQLARGVRVRLPPPVGLVAAGGSGARLRRRRRGLAADESDRARRATLAAAFGPYLIFDVLFQETVTTRYALPLVVPVALLAAAGLAAISRWGVWAAAGLAGVALAVGHPTLTAYASDGAPAFRMLADMRAESSTAPAPPLGVHRRQDFDLRRPLRWLGSDAPAFSERLAAPPRLEWLELVKYWNGGGRRTLWFVSDPLRSDLALVHHDGPRAGLPLAASVPRADWRRSTGGDGVVRARGAGLVSRRGLVADAGNSGSGGGQR